MSDVDLSHLRKPLNATVFHYKGTVDVQGLMLPGTVWLYRKTEKGSSGQGDPTLRDLAGYDGKHVKVTMIVEEVEEPCESSTEQSRASLS